MMRILHLEDDPLDAALVQETLRGAGLLFNYVQAATRNEFVQLLKDFVPELILADYRLPQFDGLAALDLAREACPETPFLFISGTLGEETAIEALKQGATDYVLKDRLARLAPAVERAMKEAATNHDRLRAGEEIRAQAVRLRQSENRLRALAVHLQSVREEEATLLARELHDDLGQNLTGLKMDLAWLDRRFLAMSSSGQREELRQRVANMSEAVDGMIQEVRHFCTQLRPGVLDELGLISALQWQADAFQARTEIACRLDLPKAEMDVERDLSTAIFRIFQEILTNIARHAAATEVRIAFAQEKGQWILHVVDNGLGVSPDKIDDSKSIGLLGMRERAQAVGGIVSISGKPDMGTTVRVEIPIADSGSGLHNAT